jgi:hypothetical protein
VHRGEDVADPDVRRDGCLIANCEPSCGVSGKLDGGGMETSTTDAPTEAAAADGAGDSAPSEAGEQ